MTTAMTGWRFLRSGAADHHQGDREGAAAARLRAEQALAYERIKADQAAKTAASLRDLRHKNHFADLIYDAMRGVPDAGT